MNYFSPEFLRMALLAAPAILLSLTVHEFFHARIALKFGDTTARDMGRLTLNPLAHLDVMGTIMMFLSHFTFGWAKPVPINPMNLRGNWRVADFWISAAGPLSNLGMALVGGLVYRMFIMLGAPPPEALSVFIRLFVQINVGLAFFNLIPLFPLDGSHILRSVLPAEYGPQLDQFQRIAPFILLALILFNGVWLILGPVVRLFIGLFLGPQYY